MWVVSKMNQIVCLEIRWYLYQFGGVLDYCSCSVEYFTCHIDLALWRENYIRNGRASFVDRRKNRRKDNVIMKLFVWLLQRVAEMLRNLVLIVSWPNLRPSWLEIFRILVSVVSYKIFELFFCKKNTS